MEKTLAYYITLLRRDFTAYCNEKLQELGLSQGLVFFVIYVGKHPGCSPGELARALSMDTGHVTRSLAKLEQGGFLCQLCDEKDRRAHTLKLLEKGQQAFRVSHEMFTQWDDTVMGKMTENERAQLLSLLNRLAQTERGDFCARNNAQPD